MFRNDFVLSLYHYFSYNANVDVHTGDGNVPLNGDHTHFIMVDDGSRYRFFGKSTDFITRFEEMVRSPDVSCLAFLAIWVHVIKKSYTICKGTKFYSTSFIIANKGLGLPIVTILLEGGKEAIRIVKERLMVGISCIVIEGNHFMYIIIILENVCKAFPQLFHCVLKSIFLFRIRKSCWHNWICI